MNWDFTSAKKILAASAPLLITASLSLLAILACQYLLPFVLALLVAAMVWPLVDWLAKFKVNRVFSSVLCLSTFFLASGFLITVLIVQMSQELMGLASEIPNFLKEAYALFNGLINQAEKAYLIVPDNLAPYVDQAVTHLASKGMIFAQNAATWLLTGISKMPGLFLILIFAVISSYVITLDKSLITQKLSANLNHMTRRRIRVVLEEMTRAVGKYLKALVILVGITFVITLIGMSLIGVNYALVGSFIIAIADLLPVLGPGSVFIPWIIWLLIVGETSKGLMMLALYGFIFVFRQAVQPKILADTMELPALPLLIAIWIGFTQFGLAGLLFSPFVLVLYLAIDKALKVQLKPLNSNGTEIAGEPPASQ